jgi:hypothetical protein
MSCSYCCHEIKEIPIKVPDIQHFLTGETGEVLFCSKRCLNTEIRLQHNRIKRHLLELERLNDELILMMDTSAIH